MLVLAKEMDKLTPETLGEFLNHILFLSYHLFTESQGFLKAGAKTDMTINQEDSSSG